MNPIERYRRWRTYQADYRQWRHTETLADLGQLTAEYVTGHRLSFPDHGYASYPGPDPETAEIAGALATLCLAGAPTLCSQPGAWIADPDQLVDAQAYAQRAAVDLLAPVNLAERFVRRATDAGLLVEATLVSSLGRRRSGHAIPVSVWTRDEVPDTPASVDVLADDEGVHWTVQTMFGAASRRDMTDYLGAIGDGAAAAVGQAVRLVAVDPQWGRQPRLWDVLVGTLR